MISELVSLRSLTVSPLTVPLVPTGIKAGVCITPLAVWISDSLAISEELFILIFILF